MEWGIWLGFEVPNFKPLGEDKTLDLNLLQTKGSYGKIDTLIGIEEGEKIQMRGKPKSLTGGHIWLPSLYLDWGRP